MNLKATLGTSACIVLIGSFMTVVGFLTWVFGWGDKLYVIAFCNPDVEDRTLLSAAEIGNLEFAKEALAACIDPNLKNKQGQTALMVAAYNHNADVVEALLDGGDWKVGDVPISVEIRGAGVAG